MLDRIRLGRQPLAAAAAKMSRRKQACPIRSVKGKAPWIIFFFLKNIFIFLDAVLMLNYPLFPFLSSAADLTRNVRG